MKFIKMLTRKTYAVMGAGLSLALVGTQPAQAYSADTEDKVDVEKDRANELKVAFASPNSFVPTTLPKSPLNGVQKANHGGSHSVPVGIRG